MAAPPDRSVDTIYAPVRGGLERVEANLRDLAAKADLSLDDRLLAQAVLSGGKKVRPALTLLAAQTSAKDEDDKPVVMATAVELLHIATLIHDDTVDGSRTRRGRATAPSLWGGKAAILLGDFVFAASATYVCDTGDIYVIRRFSETIMELARGELAEHFSAFDWTQTLDDYANRIYSKTASLFSTAAEAGGVLGGADTAASDALRRYGRGIGMAYQVMDDVLDFLGTEEELGKPVGADLLQGTLTLPTLLF
ncbi:MAG: polyprenyl synthetase family protein, partial [Chloroflexota bacterium]|nr:polyprenyl synthetase family protein [Chloroflexota bacterium]